MSVHPQSPYTNRHMIGVCTLGTLSMIVLYLMYSPLFSWSVLALFVVAAFVAWLIPAIGQHLTQQLLVFAMGAGIVWQDGDLIRHGVEVTITGIHSALLIMPIGMMFTCAITRTYPVGTHPPNDTLNPESRENVTRDGGGEYRCGS